MIKVIACKNKNEKQRLNSSSGGIFVLIAANILEKGGVVYGAAFNDDFMVEHTRVDDISDLYKLCTSKYVLSKRNNTFDQCKEDLERGKEVLYVGTPCQISALRKYLKQNYEKLLLIDFICHGAPGISSWQKYLSAISGEKIIKNVNFRDKSNGWLNYNIKIDFTDGSQYINSHKNDLYMRAFIDNSILSEMCYKCEYKGIDNRESDITLGDYWGADKLLNDFYDDKGISLVMMNTEKGRNQIQNIINNIDYVVTDINKAVIYNSSLIEASMPSVFKEKIKLYEKKHGSFYQALYHYYNPSFYRKTVGFIYKKIHRILRKH